VLLKPPFNRETLLLWLTPALVLLAGGMAVVLRRRSAPPRSASMLQPDEEARLAALAPDPHPRS
jgi:cytochrome c-type biogenesis protein CcmH